MTIEDILFLCHIWPNGLFGYITATFRWFIYMMFCLTCEVNIHLISMIWFFRRSPPSDAGVRQPRLAASGGICGIWFFMWSPHLTPESTNHSWRHPSAFVESISTTMGLWRLISWDDIWRHTPIRVPFDRVDHNILNNLISWSTHRFDRFDQW